MFEIEWSKISVPYCDQNEDRLAIFVDDERYVFVVADGAGGVGAGAVAASMLIHEIEQAFNEIHSADEWSCLLRQIDSRMAEGQSAAVVVDIRPFEITGSSVGDCQAWIVNDGNTVSLTDKQKRKPLLGSGDAEPVSFTHGSLQGRLIVASDGFFSYAKRDAILPKLAGADLFAIPRKCVEMVQLPSGELWDDTSVIVARPKNRHPTRRRFQL